MLFKRTRELIDNPRGVDQYRDAMSASLLGQANVLLENGWVPKSVAAYVEAVALDPDLNDQTMMTVLTEQWYEAHRVGSPLFTKMFISGFHRGSATATDRLAMLYRVLGFQIDETNFVQMTHLGNWQNRESTPNLYYLAVATDQELKDYWDFVNRVAFMIRLKYRAWHGIRSLYATSQTLTATLDNQLRYYLAKPVVDYVQQNGLTRSTYEVKVYELTGKEALQPAAKFHNRGVADDSNVKVVTPDYHLELIFNQTEELVSMWLPLERHAIEMADGSTRFIQQQSLYATSELQAIANTESANFAGQGGDIHEALDIKPMHPEAGVEPFLRIHAKKEFPYKN